jgi:hypothetical protein
MVFVLYKHNDNELLFTGIYENENDAIEIKNLYNDDSFKIVNLPFWKNPSNKEKIFYNEEDNNINESELEHSPQVRKRRRIYNKELINDVKDVKDVKDIKDVKYDKSNIYRYMVLSCIIVLFFLLNILLIVFHYILYRYIP